MDRRVPFSGILSHEVSENPDFFNWNKVKIRYCDGASLSGNPESESQNRTNLFFRGQRIWEATMDELLSLGLAKADQALLSGCSAGGLAALIHCDEFQEILPKDAKVKCLSDASFFLDEENVSGNRTMRSFYHDVVHLQGVAKSLNKDCITKMEPSQCFFPQEIVKYIKTPVFLVNPAYDFWQIQNVLAPYVSDPLNEWRKCKLNIKNCNPSQLEILQGFRNSMLKAMSEFQQNRNGGMYINSCFVHCQTWMASTWHSMNSPRINNKEMEPNDDRIPGGLITQQIRDLRLRHRATQVWNGEIDTTLKLRSHERTMRRWRSKLTEAQVTLISEAEFGHYCDIRFGNHDTALCAALGERWWPSTSSFHFPFGEMTITLEDVHRILGLPISGEPILIGSQPNAVELLGRELPSGGGSLVLLSWLANHFMELPEHVSPQQIEQHTRAYLWAVCGSSLFPDGTGNNVHTRLLRFFADLSQTSSYAWGAAVLACLYNGLSRYANQLNNELVGCVTLLQVWSYEHLPVGRPLFPDPILPRAIAWSEKEYRGDGHHSRRSKIACRYNFTDIACRRRT